MIEKIKIAVIGVSLLFSMHSVQAKMSAEDIQERISLLSDAGIHTDSWQHESYVAIYSDKCYDINELGTVNVYVYSIDTPKFDNAITDLTEESIDSCTIVAIMMDIETYGWGIDSKGYNNFYEGTELCASGGFLTRRNQKGDLPFNVYFDPANDAVEEEPIPYDPVVVVEDEEEIIIESPF